jgi:predicted nucleic acid-binding protein
LQTFDASSLIHAWDNYPPEQFPPMWRWVADQITAGEFTVPHVAYEEVAAKTPECAAWLKNVRIQRLPITAVIIQQALKIKNALGIQEDSYHPKGVGENDILIIATAAISDAELISNEARQTRIPDIAAKRKIPSVCAMAEVQVRCLSFIEMVRASGEVFGN